MKFMNRKPVFLERQDWKDSVVNATTANVTLSAEQTIDGVLTVTSRILVKNQTTGSENGIYVTAAGAWTRASDFDDDVEVTAGTHIFVSEGTANGDITFVLTTNDPITVGTTALAFTNITSSGGAIGGSTGSTDNAILRADGTGGSTAQSSAVIVDDSDNVTGVTSLTVDGSSGNTVVVNTTDLVVDSTNNRVGIGSATPNSLLHVKANAPGTVGDNPAGQLIIQDPDDNVNANAVITGYKSDVSGNPDVQLWYLGSSSGSNANIILLNRRNATLSFGTNGLIPIIIETDGSITVTGTVDGRDLATDGTKLDGIETAATIDQTNAEIKTAYEANANTNEFSTAEQGKLSGIATLADKFVGKHTIWVPATAMYTRTTTGATAGSTELATNDVMLETFDFITGSDQHVQFAVAMPKSWNLGTVLAQFFWSHPSTATNFGVTFGIQAVAFANDDAQDTAFGTIVTTDDTGGTTDDLYVSPESGAITVAGTPADDELTFFQILRDVSDANDTLAVDARLQGVKIIITTDAANDD